MERLNPSSSLIVVVDVQEKLVPAMDPDSMNALMRSSKIMLEAADALGVKVLATEQYPKGLGPTVPDVSTLLQGLGVTPFEKIAFSACDAEGFEEQRSGMQIKSVVVIGMETHVCVFQTVRDLVNRGLDVVVPVDGVASRRVSHRDTGLSLCREAGAVLSTTETIAFDWLKEAGGEAFKRLSKLIR